MRDQFHRNQSLVVIRSDHDIELPAVRAEVKTVRGMRARNSDSFGFALPYGGRKNIDVLAAEHSAFTGVRIDCCNSDPALPEFEPAQFGVHETDELNVVLRRDPAERFPD